MGDVKYASERSIAAVLAGVGVETLFDVAAVRQAVGSPNAAAMLRAVHFAALQIDALTAAQALDGPMDAILHCPVCHAQHRDDDDAQCRCAPNYTSHLCRFCGNIWRPAARATYGVEALELHGRTDTWPALGRKADLKEGYPVSPAPLVPPLEMAAEAARQAGKSKATHPAGKAAPPNCRRRLRDEGKALPRAGCVECDPENEGLKCPYLGEM